MLAASPPRGRSPRPEFFIFVGFSKLINNIYLKNIIRTVNVMLQNNILKMLFEGFENTAFLKTIVFSNIT